MDAGTTQSTGLVGILTWVEVNKKRLLYGGGIVAVAIFVALIVVQRQSQKELNASHALSEVRFPFGAGAPVTDGAADALLKVAEDHKGTKAAARAMLLSAGVLFGQDSAKTYTDALARFTRVIQEYPESPQVADASLGVAASLAALGKTAEATAKYEEIGRRFEKSPIANDAKLGLAKLYEAGGKSEDAFKLYDQLTQGSARGPVAMEAEMRGTAMLKAHPELAKLRTPPTPPPGMTMPNLQGGSNQQQIQITPAMLSNAMQRARTEGASTNAPMITVTNRPSAGQPAPPPVPAPAPPPPPTPTQPK